MEFNYSIRTEFGSGDCIYVDNYKGFNHVLNLFGFIADKIHFKDDNSVGVWKAKIK